jgi:predicted ATPase/class 3 adenylate cyclase
MSDPAPQADDPLTTGRRSYVTLLFADLCDYTSLNETLDPEETDALRSELESLAEGVVRKHGGLITQFYGDGQLCVFGFPSPHEDDVRRGVDAALELHASVRKHVWAALQRNVQLCLHTGIHAGLVFARRGSALHGRYQLAGDAVNTAARLCSAAQRDEIFISAAALRGSEQFFEGELVPQLVLKGKKLPLSAFRVTGRSDVRTRFEASARRGLTEFVDRHAELSALIAGVTASLSGRGSLLLVTGAAGIGKTRLLEEFRARATTLGARVFRGTCDNYGELVPLAPFSQILRQVFSIAASMDASDAVQFVEGECARLGASLQAELAIFLRLMSLLPAQAHELANAGVVQALGRLFDTLASQQPVTLILDDWQWADDASRAVLGALHHITLQRGGCIVIGMRASDLHDPTLEPDRALGLAPLSDADGSRVIAALRPQELGLNVTQTLLRRAGGNPLFLEELCRALPRGRLDEHKHLDPSEVPHTLQGVIQTRVAALPRPHAALLQTAAVIGIEFSTAMLEPLFGAGVAELSTMLAALARDDLVYATEVAGIYRFKHGLTRDVVYESVLMSKRRALHAKVAALIEADAQASGAANTSEALAYHYRGSGDYARAAAHAELAGDRAMAVSALDRARFHYLAALTALDQLPPSAAIKQRWLRVSRKWMLPFVYSPVRDQLDILHRAMAAAAELGDDDAKAACWHWLGWAHYTLGDYAQSIQNYQAALQLAQRVSSARLVAQLLSGLGQSQAAAGDYPGALEHLQAGLAQKRAAALAQPARRDRIAQGYAYALGCMALVHADRGEFDLAEREFDEALSTVASNDHAIHGSVLGLRCMSLIWRGRWADAQEVAARDRRNSQHVVSGFSFAISSCFEAYAAWRLTAAFEHVRRMRDMVDWLRAQQLELFASFHYAHLAEALAAHGDQHARTYVEYALARARSGDPLGAAAAYRVLATLHPDAGVSSEQHVENCLGRAHAAAAVRGAVHDLARTTFQRAQLQRRAGRVADAKSNAEASLVQFEALGMEWHAASAREFLAACAR